MKLYLNPTTGRDEWSGRLKDPASDVSDGPLASLPGVMKRLRNLRQKVPCPEPIEINLAAGVYELREPLDFDHPDLSYLTFVSEVAGQALIRGGERITGWRPCEVNGVAAWVVELPDVKRGDWYFRSLFVDGRRCPRARFPKLDVESKDWNVFRIKEIRSPESGVRSMNLHDGDHCFRPKDGDVENWASLPDAEAVVLHYWIDERLPGLRFDSETGWLYSSHNSHFNLRAAFDDRLARYYIDNLFEALCEPGEWYLERKSGRLYYIPREGETPDNTDIHAPRICQFIRVQPKAEHLFDGRFSEHLNFSGLTFEVADWEPLVANKARHDEPAYYSRPLASAAQNTTHLPGSIDFRYARHCSVKECDIRHVGFFGVAANVGCRDIVIQKNHIEDVGGGGVKILGGDGLESDLLKTTRVQVTDNEVHRLGRVFHAGAGVVVVHASHNTIVHNHIYDLFNTAVGCGMIWSYKKNRSHDNRIAFNHIHHFGQGLLSDMGGVYILGVQPGTTVENNWIHDGLSEEYGAQGIYLDECAAHIVVSKNVVHDCSGAAFVLHKGRENLIRNNIIVGSGWDAFEIGNEDGNSGLMCIRNLIIAKPGTPNVLGGYGLDIFKTKSIFEGNLYWAGAKGAAQFGNVDFEGTPHYKAVDLDAWRKTGQDAASLEEDPMLVGLGTRDVRLSKSSPVFAKLGFQAIDLQSTGPREVISEELKESYVSTQDMKF